jgi:hypothetical protein
VRKKKEIEGIEEMEEIKEIDKKKNTTRWGGCGWGNEYEREAQPTTIALTTTIAVICGWSRVVEGHIRSFAT